MVVLAITRRELKNTLRCEDQLNLFVEKQGPISKGQALKSLRDLGSLLVFRWVERKRATLYRWAGQRAVAGAVWWVGVCEGPEIRLAWYAKTGGQVELKNRTWGFQLRANHRWHGQRTPDKSSA